MDSNLIWRKPDKLKVSFALQVLIGRRLVYAHSGCKCQYASRFTPFIGFQRLGMGWFAHRK